jgi:hypothetical protein
VKGFCCPQKAAGFFNRHSISIFDLVPAENKKAVANNHNGPHRKKTLRDARPPKTNL